SASGTSLGAISLNQSDTFSAQGGAAGTNGNIKMIGSSLAVGAISGNGPGSAATGSLFLGTGSPLINGGSVVCDGTTGAVTSGSFSLGSPVTASGTINLTSANVGGNVDIRATNGSAQVNGNLSGNAISMTANGGNVILGTTGTPTIQAITGISVV